MKFFFTLLLGILFITVSAQSYKYVYYLDGNMASTTEKNAFFIGKGIPDNGLLKVDYFHKEKAVLFMSIHFTDSSLSTMTGFFTSYFINGKKENEGIYKNNLEDGLWEKWDSAGHKKDSSVYSNGIRTTHATYEYYNKGGLREYEFTDSLNDKYNLITYDSNGIKKSEAVFTGQTGINKIYDSSGVRTETLSSREREEASFSGGEKGWRMFLQQNLDPNVPVEKGAPEGRYQVIVKFIVNIDGIISDIVPETNFGFGMEVEVIRLIKMSPAWKPAILFGVPVKAYRRQPVTFYIDEGMKKN